MRVVPAADECVYEIVGREALIFLICDTAAEHFTSLKWHPLYVDVVGRVVTMLSTSTLSELYRASPVPEAAHVS